GEGEGRAAWARTRARRTCTGRGRTLRSAGTGGRWAGLAPPRTSPGSEPREVRRGGITPSALAPRVILDPPRASCRGVAAPAGCRTFLIVSFASSSPALVQAPPSSAGWRPPCLLTMPTYGGTLAAARALGAAGVAVTVAGEGLLAPARWSRSSRRFERCPPPR